MGWHSFGAFLYHYPTSQHCPHAALRRAGLEACGMTCPVQPRGSGRVSGTVRTAKRSPNEAGTGGVGLFAAMDGTHKGREPSLISSTGRTHNPRTKQVGTGGKCRCGFWRRRSANRKLRARKYPTWKDAYDQTCPLAYFQKSTSRKRVLCLAPTQNGKNPQCGLVILLADVGRTNRPSSSNL